MAKPTFFRGRPIIQPGEIYEIEGTLYKIVTATSRIIGEDINGLTMTQLLYWLENTETKEIRYIGREELEAQFKEETEY